MTAPAVSSRTRQAQDYLAAVEHELADLPAEDRSALHEDLALHLEALAAEDDDRPIAVRLGPADAYAADLRSAAGLPARGAGALPPMAGLRDRLDRMRATPAARRVAPVARATQRLLNELRPAWWVLRGYLLVLVPCLVDVDGARDFPVPAPWDSPVLGVPLVILAIAGSVALGRRKLSRPAGVFLGVAGAVLAVMPLGIWQSASETGLTRGSSNEVWAAPAPAPEKATSSYPLISRYGPVTDVFPYAADGTPLEGVLLFDQDGRPLHVGRQGWWADGCARVLEQPRAADGVPVPNSFPQKYVLDPSGTDLYGIPVSPGMCVKDVPRPDVPLPVFPTPPAPAAPAPAPAPAD
jgi:hypothetical protein